MQNVETCGFIFIEDDVGEPVLCTVVYDADCSDFIAEVDFGSGNQIIAGINDMGTESITNELLSAVKNQLESQHEMDPRLVGMICGQEASYTLYADKQFSKRPHSGPSETLSGEYYLADADE